MNITEQTSYKPGFTNLYYAIVQKDADRVEQLCQENADVNQPSLPNHQTPLVQAASLGDTKIMEILIRFKANPNVWCPYSDPPLTKASKKGHAAAVKLLLASGAIAGRKPVQDQGISALGYAVHKEHHKVVKELLDADIDPNDNHFCGESALEVALNPPNKKVIDALISHGASFDKIDHVSGKTVDDLVQKNILTAIKALVESLKKREDSLTVEWEVSQEDGWPYGKHNVLHTAYRYDRPEIINFLHNNLPTMLFLKLSLQRDMWRKYPCDVESISKNPT